MVGGRSSCPCRTMRRRAALPASLCPTRRWPRMASWFRLRRAAPSTGAYRASFPFLPTPPMPSREQQQGETRWSSWRPRLTLGFRLSFHARRSPLGTDPRTHRVPPHLIERAPGSAARRAGKRGAGSGHLGCAAPGNAHRRRALFSAGSYRNGSLQRIGETASRGAVDRHDSGRRARLRVQRTARGLQ